MKPLGTSLPNELFPHLVRVRVIEEFEMPLLVEYREPNSGEAYLYSWVSCEPQSELTRWMVFRVSSRSLAAYLKQVISFWDLIRTSPDRSLYLRDIHRDSSVVHTSLLPIEQLPVEYRPDPNALHDQEDRPRHFSRDSPWTLLINGTWELHDLHQVPHLYRKAYNGLYLFGPIELPQNTPAVDAWSDTVRNFDIDVAEGRGGAATRLFNHIEDGVPHGSRVSLVRIHLASPGELSLRLNCDIAELLQQVLHAFAQSSGIEHYNRLYLERHRDESDISLEELKIRTVTMCEILRIDWCRVSKSFPQIPTRADFILAQARYIKELAKYLRDKKIEWF